MTPCRRAGCGKPARFVPRLCVPVVGAVNHPPVTTIIRAPLCEFHAAQVMARDYPRPDPAPETPQRAAMRALAAPHRLDFAGAYVERLALDDPAYQRLIRQPAMENAA